MKRLFRKAGSTPECHRYPGRKNNFPVVHYPLNENMLENSARHFFEESKHLDILSYCTSSDCRGKHFNLPTRISCFEHSPSIIPLVLGIFDGQDIMALFSAGGPGSVLNYRLYDELSTLSLHGYLFDHIAMTFSIVSDHLDDLFERLLNTEPHSSMSCQYRRIGASQVTQSCVEAFWITILADQWHLGKRVDHKSPQDSVILPKSMEEHRNLCQDPALLTHLRFVVGWQLVITKPGYRGLAPEKPISTTPLPLFPEERCHMLYDLSPMILCPSLSGNLVPLPGSFESGLVFVPPDIRSSENRK